MCGGGRSKYAARVELRQGCQTTNIILLIVIYYTHTFKNISRGVSDADHWLHHQADDACPNPLSETGYSSGLRPPHGVFEQTGNTIHQTSPQRTTSGTNSIQKVFVVNC